MSLVNRKFLNKHFSLLVYIFALLTYLYLLFYGRSIGLFPLPGKGTDQLSMLCAAARICKGEGLPMNYQFSPAYTYFLAFLAFLAGGNLFAMRLLQALICALVPLFVYKVARKMRLGFPAAQLSALLYCFYGPALLISLSFLRATPLSLVFLIFVYFVLSAFMRKSQVYYLAAGFAGILCILGRENFIPVFFFPFLFLFLSGVKRNIKAHYIFLYSLPFILIILPILFYNYFIYGYFSIVPGLFKIVMTHWHGAHADISLNSDLLGRVFSRLPGQFYSFISSFEVQNSLSFYAHRDIVDFLWMFIVPYNFIFALALVSIFLYRKNLQVCFIGLAVLSYIFTMLYFGIYYRLRIPIVPLLSVLAGPGLYYLLKLDSIKKIFLWVCVIVFFIMTYSFPSNLRDVRAWIQITSATVLFFLDSLKR